MAATGLSPIFDLARNLHTFSEHQRNWSTLDKKIFYRVCWDCFYPCTGIEVANQKLEHRINILKGVNRPTFVERIEALWVWICECVNGSFYATESALIVGLIGCLDADEVSRKIEEKVSDKPYESLQTFHNFFNNMRREFHILNLQAKTEENKNMIQYLRGSMKPLPKSLSTDISSMIEGTRRDCFTPSHSARLINIFSATVLLAAKRDLSHSSYNDNVQALVQEFEERYSASGQ